jgi:hypothetical protein
MAVLQNGIRVGGACIAIAVALLCTSGARAAPWADVGDPQLRSDVEVLAASGLVDNVTTQWPLPWGGLLNRLERPTDYGVDSEPDFVRSAAERLQSAGGLAVQPHRVTWSVMTDLTNLPDVVRGFDGLGREDIQGQIGAEWVGEDTAIKLQVGAQTLNHFDRQILLLDGSYIAQRVGNVAFYAGYQTHWWGPGWSTALSLSNNARPFPQIGYRRLGTQAFSTPWLSWLGPWDHEMFIGVLDGKRQARNTLFHGMRWAFNPLTGFEVSLAHLQELCGTGHPCEPIAEFFNVQNNNSHPSKSKDETDFDLRYTNTFDRMPYAVYTQFMDRDTGPFVHSDTNHLFGASIWLPIRRTALRLTAEYADTISTGNFFTFGKDFYSITYNDYKYTDGWQYRGRILGSSLGTDSRLTTLQASWSAPHRITYSLSYYRASISSPNSQAGANTVTTAPVTIDIGEARISFPVGRLSVALAARVQDDQPRPDRGAIAAVEAELKYQV